MKTGDLVMFMADGGRFEIGIRSIGLVLDVEENPYGHDSSDFLFDVLMDGKIIKGILNDNEYQRVISDLS